MKPLNFTKLKKSYFSITFNDENQTTILVACPTKKMVDDLIAFEESLKAVNDGELTGDATGELYATCAKLLSRNKTGKAITKEFLEETLDIEDINTVYNSYMEFVIEIANSKN
jgi:Zn-dependent alcohol dehydrogenase